jgi:hypothetical protein
VDGLAVGGFSTTGVSCSGVGFAWSEAAGLIVLPTPSGYCTAKARVLNAAGLIAGSAQNATDQNGPDPDVVRWLPTGPGTWSVEVLPRPGIGLGWRTVHGVNTAGNLITTWANPDGTIDSWIWSSARGWERLPPPAGRSSCSAEGLNDNDEVVGYCNATVSGAYYWATPGSVPRLLPAPTGGNSSWGNSILNTGVIVGSWVRITRRGSESFLARWLPNGPGGWTVQDLGLSGDAKDQSPDRTVLGREAGDWFLIVPGAPISHLDVFDKSSGTSWAALGDQGPSGIRWIAGWAAASPSAGGGTRALIWKR